MHKNAVETGYFKNFYFSYEIESNLYNQLSSSPILFVDLITKANGVDDC